MSKFAEKVWKAFNLKARPEDKERFIAIIDAALKKQRGACRDAAYSEIANIHKMRWPQLARKILNAEIKE